MNGMKFQNAVTAISNRTPPGGQHQRPCAIGCRDGFHHGFQFFVGDGIQQAIDEQHSGTTGPHTCPGTRRDQHALACTLAALLSAKTGQPESPQRVMQMSKG